MINLIISLILTVAWLVWYDQSRYGNKLFDLSPFKLTELNAKTRRKKKH